MYIRSKRIFRIYLNNGIWKCKTVISYFTLPPDFLRGKGIRMSDSRRLGLLRFLGASKQSWNKAIRKVSQFHHKRQFMQTLMQACCCEQWHNYRLDPGGNIAEEGTQATVGCLLANSQKTSRNDSESLVDVDNKTWNHWKTIRKTQAKINLLKTERILNTNVWAKWGPGFYI